MKKFVECAVYFYLSKQGQRHALVNGLPTTQKQKKTVKLPVKLIDHVYFEDDGAAYASILHDWFNQRIFFDTYPTDRDLIQRIEEKDRELLKQITDAISLLAAGEYAEVRTQLENKCAALDILTNVGGHSVFRHNVSGKYLLKIRSQEERNSYPSPLRVKGSSFYTLRELEEILATPDFFPYAESVLQVVDDAYRRFDEDILANSELDT